MGAILCSGLDTRGLSLGSSDSAPSCAETLVDSVDAGDGVGQGVAEEEEEEGGVSALGFALNILRIINMCCVSRARSYQ